MTACHVAAKNDKSLAYVHGNVHTQKREQK